MKVLLVSNMYPSDSFPHLGTFVKNSENTLVDSGFDLDRIVINRKSKSFFDKVYIYLCFYFSILFKLITSDYKYIYAHYISHVSLPLLIYKSLNPSIKIVLHAHGSDIKKLNGSSSLFFKVKCYFSKKIISKSHKVIVPSASYKLFLCNEFKVDKNLVSIYPSGGVNTAIFNCESKSEMNGLIGFAGRLIKSKNVDLIIKAVAKLPDNFKLEIVGTGEEKNNLKKLVDKLNVNDRVLFFDSKSQVDLAIWYKKINFLIYPSESESLGLVPLEAMACGVHCVLSNIPAFNEFADNSLVFSTLDSLSSIDIYTSVINFSLNDSENFYYIDKVYSSENSKNGLLNVFE